MAIAALAGAADRPPIKQALRATFQRSLGVVRLGAVTAVLLALALVPFVLLAVLTYNMLLTEHDIYFYVKDRPPVFWDAAGIGGLLLLAALADSAVLYVWWAFALPILLFENRSARAALRASRARVRGVAWRVGFILAGWSAGMLLFGAALEAAFRLFATAVLATAGERPIIPLLLLLLVQGALVATLTFFFITGLGLVTRQLYLLRSEQLGLYRPVEGQAAPGQEKPPARWNWRLAWLSLPLFAVAPLVLWANLSRYTVDRPVVQVTAHRGHSRAAPENTLSSVRRAIASGADYAEVEVQSTADGVIVLLHDRDLKRVAGVSWRLDELSYNEVRKLDVGSWFDPAFAGEPVPTLAEVINLARGRIKLNLELKFFGLDRRLAAQVARLVREQEFESDCLVTSLDYDALLEVKRNNPRLRTGLIVAHSLGDVSRLEVEVLSIRWDWLTDDLLRAAYRRGQEVHVWTVNDPSQMARLTKRGVDNIITSDPDLAVQVRNEWANLSGTERLVLASRLLLGLDP
jgi:glycerophosphoryl diester phosphodiesterase